MWWLWVALAAAEGPDVDTPPDETAVLDAIVGQVRGLASFVSKARGLPLPEPLEIQVHTPAQVREAAREELDEPWAVDSMACAQAQLEGLGVIDAGFDLRATTETIQEAAIAGYFDAEIDRLVVVARPGAFASGADLGEEDLLTATHELVHAAQDAAHDLFTMRHRDLPTSDVDLALRGLVEGDATWWMIPLSAGQSAAMLRAVPAELIAQIASQDPTSAGDPMLAALPGVLRADLVSPYMDGLVFAHALQNAGGTAAVDAAFEDPPLSSEQILHPERYLERDVPVLLEPSVEAASVGEGWTVVCDDGLGERLMRALFEDVEGVDATRAAAGWDGDRIRTLRHADGRVASLLVSVWDHPDDAREAAAAWQAREGSQVVLVRRDRVAVVRGLDDERLAKRLARALIQSEGRPLDDLEAISTTLPVHSTGSEATGETASSASAAGEP